MEFEIKDNILRGITLEDGETDVVIPYGVTEIGYGAFRDCTQLTSVSISNTVTQIKDKAFKNCTGLTTLYIPQNVAKIKGGAFSGCQNLVTNLSIRECDRRYGLENLDYALNYMRHYQSGDPFFDNVKSDNNRYIRAHRKELIRKITVDDAAVVSYIMQESCLSVDDIDYLLKKLGENVEITALLLDYKKKTYTDEYLEQLETERFEKEVGIRERTLADWKKIYTLGKNDLEGGYILKQYKGTDTEVLIPDHIAGEPVTRIGKHCFSPMGKEDPDIKRVCEKIRTVYIPDTVICIETGAFQACKSLADVTIPNSVVNIESCAFEFCSSLTEVTLPDSLFAIPEALFLMCTSLTRVNIPNSAGYIGMSAFGSCSKLAEIDIPDSVEKIGKTAFSCCYALKRVTLPKGLKTISANLFDMCIALTEIEIPESVTVIQGFVFHSCLALTEITIPEGVTSIERGTFRDCNLLEKVTLPEGLKTIEDHAFSKCVNLHEITIPAKVKSIVPNAFDNSGGIVISAPCGSYAIEYAKKNGFEFKEI